MTDKSMVGSVGRRSGARERIGWEEKGRVLGSGSRVVTGREERTQ